MIENTTPPAPKHPSAIKEFLLFMSIPAAITLVVLGLVMVPSWLAKPKYDFIYSVCAEYDCDSTFEARNERIVSKSLRSTDKDVPSDQYGRYDQYDNYAPIEAKLYYHDISKNASRPLSVDEASQYKVNTSNVSPDGYVFKRGSDSENYFFIGGSADYSWYLKQGLGKKRLNINTSSEYFGSDDIKLLGWVIK